MHVGSPLGKTARCKMVKLAVLLPVSINRSPPDNAKRSISMDELDAKFKKLPLNPSLVPVHFLDVAEPIRSKRL